MGAEVSARDPGLMACTIRTEKDEARPGTKDGEFSCEDSVPFISTLSYKDLCLKLWILDIVFSLQNCALSTTAKDVLFCAKWTPRCRVVLEFTEE